MGILRRKKDKEKFRVIIAFDFNTTPKSLLSALRFMILVMFIVAWLHPFLVMFLYMLGYLSLILLLFAGLDLRKKGKSFGVWIVLCFFLTLFFGTFAFSSSYMVFVAGGYMTAVFGNVVPLYFAEREMERDEEVREVFERGYIAQTEKQ